MQRTATTTAKAKNILKQVSAPLSQSGWAGVPKNDWERCPNYGFKNRNLKIEVSNAI
jgi:hypothetical protein